MILIPEACVVVFWIQKNGVTDYIIIPGYYIMHFRNTGLTNLSYPVTDLFCLFTLLDGNVKPYLEVRQQSDVVNIRNEVIRIVEIECMGVQSAEIKLLLNFLSNCPAVLTWPPIYLQYFASDVMKYKVVAK